MIGCILYTYFYIQWMFFILVYTVLEGGPILNNLYIFPSALHYGKVKNQLLA